MVPKIPGVLSDYLFEVSPASSVRNRLVRRRVAAIRILFPSFQSAGKSVFRGPPYTATLYTPLRESAER